MIRRKRILFLTTGDVRQSSARFRVYQYLPYLEQTGKFDVVDVIPVNTHLNPWRLGQSLMNVLLKSRDADIIFVQKLRLLPSFLKKLTRGKKVVYDFDDAVFFPPPKWPVGKSYETRKRLADAMMQNADHVIAGNGFLAEYAQRLNPSVSVIPTVVDTGQLLIAPEYYLKWGFSRQVFAPEEQAGKNRGAVTIGWIGGAGSLRFLDYLASVLSELQREFSFRLSIISNEPWKHDSLSVSNKGWSLVDEVADIQTFDIGLMPLDVTNPFVLGKCGFKLIEYMACGIPAVATPVGVNESIVDQGINGFLARSREDWANYLRLLLQDSHLRLKIGLNARQKIEKAYSIAYALPKLLAILRKM